MGQLLGSLTNASPINEAAGPQPIQPGKANFVDPSTLPQVEQPKPSFLQAANSGPGGTPNALSPQLSKGGKLVTLLMSGVKGGLASAGQRTVGGGFQQGMQLPFLEARNRQQAQAGDINNQIAQAGLQQIDTPYGKMPVGAAGKIIAPYLGYEGKIGAAQIGAQSQQNIANTQAQTQQQIHRYIPVAGVGLFDTQSKQVMPGTSQGITITPEIANDYNLPLDFLGKPMTLQGLASVQRSSVFENVPQMTAQGPIITNRRDATAKPVTGPGGQRYSPPALASPREVADPNNPGQTITLPAGQTFGKPGVQSASVQVPKKAAMGEVPTKIGDTKLAFTTAMQHADLLRSAVTALGNGDQQTLNALKNRFKTEFGSTGPVTAQVISDAYAREVQKGLSSGHITKDDTKEVAKGLNVNRQSAQQALAAIDAYKNLFQSKMNMLSQQQQSAVNKSQPGGGKNDPLGIR